ncbi:hypothetical protein TI10_04250 [Photorhabdus luminescens subsp. luminescens]|uniref:DUF2516 family protein n=1 Tax=Photorhabdus luminescens TaxID=29488 RepID=A0A1G5R1P9_PHOLU|nr:hypothetical protein [Photorhabdus luminescens]KMW74960.1 hypothetical protein TI10_04250 [Photorhabdus luminescens subsp. luminescens]SCZ67876.1 hypothetical protein SAMN02982990_02807 [Photorhabdus luminescens]
MMTILFFTFIFVFSCVLIFSFGKNAAEYYRQERQSGKFASKEIWKVILGSAAIAIFLIAFFVSPGALFGLILLLFIYNGLKTTPDVASRVN